MLAKTNRETQSLFLRLSLAYSLLFLPLPGIAMAYEEPNYEVIEKSDSFELRVYKPIIVAEALVDGDMNKASGDGFNLIADYIFGNNKSRMGSSEKISMTAPVSLQRISGKWRMHFVMPSKYTLETLPAPNNSQVMLREIAAKKFAVVIFSGIASEAKTAKKTEELLAWMASEQLKPTGVPELARYNPPWTLPFFRRNEVMVEY